MSYNFPVAIEPIYTRTGVEVPKVKAVVRQDTQAPLAAVSTKYKLIEHDTVVRGAQDFLSAFGGNVEEQVLLSPNGGRMVYQLTYRDRTLALAKGEMVGLRVYVENSYTGQCAASLRIGFLVLSCLNGMVTTRDVFCARAKHVGDNELKFPEPDSIMPAFNTQISRLNTLNDIVIDRSSGLLSTLVDDAGERGILSQQGMKNVWDQAEAVKELTAWGLMQAFTNHTTHSTNMNPISRINRLGRIDAWFNDVFLDGGYTKLMEGAH